MRLDTVVLPLLGEVSLGGWAWPFTLFWYLGFINSMNLIDGLDGLASGISVLASLALVAISVAVQDLHSTLFAATALRRDGGLLLLEHQQPEDLPGRLGQHVDGPGAGQPHAEPQPASRASACRCCWRR